MFLDTRSRFKSDVGSFNMTPIIDIVFLLIIFFLVVCQLIEAENFPVAVPQSCDFAKDNIESQAGDITVTVMKNADDIVDFAVGSEKIPVSNGNSIAQRLAELIDTRLKSMPTSHKVVNLRVDKDICFDKTQYALAGIALSSATNVKLAVIRDKQIDQ